MALHPHAARAPSALAPARRSGRSLRCPTEGVALMPGELELRHGGRIAGLQVAWRLDGPEAGPVVAVLGGISAHRRVAGDQAAPGWWPALVRPGGGIDLDRYRVLGFDWLGGSEGTTGPDAGQAFPSVDPADQADVLAWLLDHLGITRLQAVVGASYGAMVALAFGVEHTARARRLVVVSGAHRPHPLATAWRSIQRRIVRLGIERGAGREALSIARGLAMTTYRSAAEFGTRFDGGAVRDGSGFRFPVDAYLDAHGESFAARVRPESYLCLSESIDLIDVDPARVRVPATLVAVTSDVLVPLEHMRELARGFGAPCRLAEIDSLYGHDAFLKEDALLEPLIADALEANPA